MKIPKKITIGGINYKVKRNQIFDDDRDGSMHWDNSLIKIKNGLSRDAENQTFLHEVVHAIDSSYLGDKIEDELGHEFIDILANALYQVLQQVEGE